MGYRGSGFDESFTKSFIEPYEKLHPGVVVEFFGVEDSATGLGQLRAQRNAPQVDLIITDISVGNILKQEGMLFSPAARSLPNYGQLLPLGKELGLEAPPLTYDRLALGYNKTAVPTEPNSWSILWDPRQSGKVIVPAAGGGDIQALAFTFVVNRIAGGGGVVDVAPAIGKIAALAPSVQTWTPHPDQFTLVANGTASLAVGWNARAQYMADRHPESLGVTIPRDGTVTQVNVMGVINGTKQPAAALEFENYALSAEAQSRFSNMMYYIPTNRYAELPQKLVSRVSATNGSVIPINWLDVRRHKRAILLQWRQRILGRED